jgi:hypothetical protein
LIRKLDWEKGLTENPLLPPQQAGEDGAHTEAMQGDQPGDKAAKGEVGTPGSIGRGGFQASHALLTRRCPSTDDAKEGSSARQYVEVAEEVPFVDESNYDESVGRLDLQLTYLWRVHGVDYYACYELLASDFGQRNSACRLLRGPRAEPGSGGDAAATGGEGAGGASMAVDGAEHAAGANGEKENGAPAAAAEAEPGPEAVEQWVVRRVKEGDPLEAACRRTVVEQKLSKWVEDQIICHADNK